MLSIWLNRSVGWVLSLTLIASLKCGPGTQACRHVNGKVHQFIAPVGPTMADLMSGWYLQCRVWGDLLPGLWQLQAGWPPSLHLFIPRCIHHWDLQCTWGSLYGLPFGLAWRPPWWPSWSLVVALVWLGWFWCHLGLPASPSHTISMQYSWALARCCWWATASTGLRHFSTVNSVDGFISFACPSSLLTSCAVSCVVSCSDLWSHLVATLEVDAPSAILLLWCETAEWHWDPKISCFYRKLPASSTLLACDWSVWLKQRPLIGYCKFWNLGHGVFKVVFCPWPTHTHKNKNLKHPSPWGLQN